MPVVRVVIDGQEVWGREGATVLEAARAAGIYLPTLCHHPDLPPAPGTYSQAAALYQGPQRAILGRQATPYEGCGLCLVEVEGYAEAQRACQTLIAEGWVIRTDTEVLRRARQENLKKILASHPHACILCPWREGCDRRTCSMGVPPQERCCDIFNHCEIRFVSEYVGIPPDTPRYTYKARPVIAQEPLFTFDWNLCIGCTRCVRVCRDVRGLGALGFVVTEDGEVTVGTQGPTLEASGCIFCGACGVVCPSGAIVDKEGKKAHNKLGFVPCVDACPAGIDIPRYVRFIAEGKYAQALAVVRERVPFPGVLGYVCYHPCETACRRGAINEPISICRLKRFAFECGEDGSWRRFSKQRPDTGQRVAIVGSGPAGLTAAYYLRKQGHAVTVFEALPQPGGMLRYGIPPFRLPRQVLDREIQQIEAIGVKIQTKTPIESLDALQAMGFDAIFLAMGAKRVRRLNMAGEELALSGLEFLRRVNAGERVKLGGCVVVIGGGNVATDCARTARRLGAQDVWMLYRRTREEMPAYAEELERALEEGVRLLELTVPLRLEREDGRLKLCGARTRLEGPEPVVIFGSEFELGCDTVIVAIGQEPEVPPSFSLEVDPQTLCTDHPGVFAGGDFVTGPASVIEAIALGRRAAQAIDRYLGGDGDIAERLTEEEPQTRSHALKDFLSRKRVEPGSLPLEQRGLECVVEQSYSLEQARSEALRCLRCDMRVRLARVPLPPRRRLQSLDIETLKQVPERAGVYRLYNEHREVVAIQGVPNLREALMDQLSRARGRFFDYEENVLYTQRESELLQEHLQKHGRLPLQNDELSDLL